MTIEETKKIIAIINANYPQVNQNDYDLELKIRTWYEEFKHIPYEAVYNALFVAMKKTTFIPKISDIFDELKNIYDNTMSELEAWEIVKNQIRYGNDYRVSDFEKLPEDIKKALGNDGKCIMNWAKLESSFIDTTIKERFIKDYKKVIEDNKNKKMLMTTMANRLEIEGGNHEKDEIKRIKQ